MPLGGNSPAMLALYSSNVILFRFAQTEFPLKALSISFSFSNHLFADQQPPVKDTAKQLEQAVFTGGINKFSRSSSDYVSKMPLKNLENPRSIPAGCSVIF